MAEERTFAQLGRVEAIRQLFEGTPYTPFEDAWFNADNRAGVANSLQTGAVTTFNRLFQEGIDFNLVYFPLKHLGYKFVVAVTGEHYAVMSHPQTLSVVLGVSAKLDFSQIKELWDGIVRAAREHGYSKLALDLVPCRNGLAVSMSSTGMASKLTCARRPKAKSKDLICVSGALGAAYLGQQILERERVKFEAGAEDKTALEKYKMLVGSYLKPELSPQTVAQLEDAAIIPSMGYFVTRGLSDAILRLSRDSGLGAKIYADKIPFEGNTFSLGKELDLDPISAAMNGGDDYKLLFTIPILQLEKFRKDFQSFDIIGHLAQPEAGAVLVTPEGVELPLRAQGWKEEEE